jgi:hypothetical protein
VGNLPTCFRAPFLLSTSGQHFRQEVSEMLKEEFEARVCYGCTISAEEYAAIEHQYMDIPEELNVFKDEFCKAYIEARASGLSVSNYLLLEKFKEAEHLKKEWKFEKEMGRLACKEQYEQQKRAEKAEAMLAEIQRLSA